MLNSKSFMLSMFLTASFFSMTTYASSLNKDDLEKEKTVKKSTHVAQEHPSNTSVIDPLIGFSNNFRIFLPLSQKQSDPSPSKKRSLEDAFGEAAFDADQIEEKNTKKPRIMAPVLHIHKISQDEMDVIVSFMSLEELYRARTISKFFHKIMHMEIPNRTVHIKEDFSKNFNAEAFRQSISKYKVPPKICLTVKNLDSHTTFKDYSEKKIVTDAINSVQEMVYTHYRNDAFYPNTVKIVQLDPYDSPEGTFNRNSIKAGMLKKALEQYQSMEILKITGCQFAVSSCLDVITVGFSLSYLTEINCYHAKKWHLPGTGILTRLKLTLPLAMQFAPKSLKTFYFVPDFVGRKGDTQPIIDFADSIKKTNIREIHVPFFCAKKIPSRTTANKIKIQQEEYNTNIQILQKSLSDADPAKNIRLIIERLDDLVHPVHYFVVDGLAKFFQWDQD